MKQSELLKSISKLTQNQKNHLFKDIRDYLRLNNDIKQEKPSVCPVCHKRSKMIKKDKQYGKQRYKCKNCNHVFVYDSHTITANMKISNDVFYQIVIDTLNIVPISKTAARLDLPVKTVFFNRHKFLTYLNDYLNKEDIKLSGTIEIDETYVLESQKGSKSLNNRKARHRGEPSKYRGLSHEQLCIVTTTDRNGHEINSYVGNGKPTTNSINQSLADKITNKSILYTDGAFCYDQLANNSESSLVQLYDHQMYNQVEHLNTVNYIHSLIKRTIRQYRGVSSKYIQRYLSLFIFLRRYEDMDDNEKMPLLIKDMKFYPFNITYRSLKTSYLST